MQVVVEPVLGHCDHCRFQISAMCGDGKVYQRPQRRADPDGRGAPPTGYGDCEDGVLRQPVRHLSAGNRQENSTCLISEGISSGYTIWRARWFP